MLRRATSPLKAAALRVLGLRVLLSSRISSKDEHRHEGSSSASATREEVEYGNNIMRMMTMICQMEAILCRAIMKAT